MLRFIQVIDIFHVLKQRKPLLNVKFHQNIFNFTSLAQSSKKFFGIGHLWLTLYVNLRKFI